MDDPLITWLSFVMEEWLKINPYDYSVSNLGRMRNDRTGRILKKRIRRDGYIMATLYCGANTKPLYLTVHRMVAMLFLKPPDNPAKIQVNHIDGNPLNNHFFNLEWVTPKENSQHAVRIGLFPRGETHHLARIKDSQIKEIREMYATGKYAQHEIGKKFGVHQSEISRYVNKIRRGGKCG